MYPKLSADGHRPKLADSDDRSDFDDVPAVRPHLLHVFPSFSLGGVPIRFSTLINHLGPSCRHTIIALDGRTDAARRLHSECAVDVKIPGFTIRNPVKTIPNIWCWLRELRPDLLLTHSWGSIDWGVVNALGSFGPHLHFESGFNPEEAEHTLRRRDIARRIILRWADRIVVPSRNLLQLSTDRWGLSPQKVDFIPNGVDCARYSCRPCPDLLPGFAKSPDETVIGSVVPLRAIKNVSKLLRVFANADWRSEARLLIVGDGVERPLLVRDAAELGVADRVFFAGHIHQPELVLGLIDIFAMTSDSEQMPNSILQAMAAGRAIVSTDVGDIAEMVAPGNRSFVVPKNDEVALDRALFALIRNPSLRARLGALNRVRAQCVYPEAKMFCSYRQLLNAFIPLG